MKNSEIQKIIGCDSLTKNKKGNYVARKSFFYKHGGSSDKFRDHVASKLQLVLNATQMVSATIIDSGEVYKAFRGGASVANQSHWYVEFKLS